MRSRYLELKADALKLMVHSVHNCHNYSETVSNASSLILQRRKLGAVAAGSPSLRGGSTTKGDQDDLVQPANFQEQINEIQRPKRSIHSAYLSNA